MPTMTLKILWINVCIMKKNSISKKKTVAYVFNGKLSVII